MTILNQDKVGRCSFIDVLEEAVLRRRPVAVQLREGGETFIDEVTDVVTERGEDFAIFRARGRIAVPQIEAVTRAEPREEPAYL